MAEKEAEKYDVLEKIGMFRLVLSLSCIFVRYTDARHCYA